MPGIVLVYLHPDAIWIHNMKPDLRIFLGGVGPKPMRASSVEKALGSARVDGRAIDGAAALVRDDVDPIDDIRGSAAYKREMSRVWTARALRSLAGL